MRNILSSWADVWSAAVVLLWRRERERGSETASSFPQIRNISIPVFPVLKIV